MRARGEPAQLRGGEAICSQGEVGDEFFILESGTAEATIAGVEDEYGRPKSVKSYQAGDFFGEKALMDESGGDGIRAATITATIGSKCLVVPGEEFKALLGSLDDKLSRVQREYDAAMRETSAGSEGPVAYDSSVPPPSEEDDNDDHDDDYGDEEVAPLPEPEPMPPPNRSRGRRTSVSAEAFGAMAAQAVQGAPGGPGSEP